MGKKILIIILFIAMFLLCTSSSMAYPLTYSGEPLIDKSQAEQYLKDRHASKKMLNCLDFIYDYAEEVGIDPSEIVAMSAIETGFGKSHLFVAYNNPGGIKSSHTSNGWAHYKTAKDGYKGMINLLATYDGLINKRSYLYGGRGGRKQGFPCKWNYKKNAESEKKVQKTYSDYQKSTEEYNRAFFGRS